MKNKIKQFFKWLFNTLKDRTNRIIFVITFLVLSSEVWIMYLLGIITGNAWFYGIASVCWAFWLAPFTPFIPLCIAVTFGIRKIVDRIRKKRRN